jgi:hemolysin III
MDVKVKPRMRGVLHQWAVLVAAVAGIILVRGASTPAERASSIVFATALTLMFTISALYHRLTWQPRARTWMRRLDHAAIYLLIAGTYTPFGLLALEGWWRWTLLPLVWGGALIAIVLKLAWTDSPKWVAATAGIVLGWMGVIAFPSIVDQGWTPVLLLLVGGIFYSAGAIVYARAKPDPIPHVFGYHELFHALVILAAACQYAAVAIFVFD